MQKAPCPQKDTHLVSCFTNSTHQSSFLGNSRFSRQVAIFKTTFFTFNGTDASKKVAVLNHPHSFSIKDAFNWRWWLGHWKELGSKLHSVMKIIGDLVPVSTQSTSQESCENKMSVSLVYFPKLLHERAG